MSETTVKNSLIIVATFILSGLVFYITPLKHVNIIGPNIDDISATQFYERYTENPENYIFVDVRPVDSYNDLHAEGSVNMPLHTLYDQRKNLPKQGKEIVLICSEGRASGVGYHYLEHHGFLNLKRIDGGIEAWHAAGLPVVFSE